MNNEKEDLFYEDRILQNGGIIEDASPSTKNAILKKVARRKNLFKIIKDGQYDIVHVHASQGLNGIDVALGKLAKAKKIVVHAHAAPSKDQFWDNDKNIFFKKAIHKVGCLLIDKLSDAKISCSTAAAKWVFPKTKNDEVFIVKNGIDLEKYKFSSDARKRIRQELHLENTFVAGTVGRLSHEKNHLFLLESLKQQLRSQTFCLIICGAGDLKDAISDYAKNEGIEDKVLLIGNTERISDYLSSMDLFLFPSLFEGLGISGIEAQISGLSCIFSTGVPEEAVLSKSTIRLPLKEEKWRDEVISFMDNYEFQESSRDVHEELCSDWSIECTARKIEDIYNQLMR